jgi:hypothetical protein
MRTVARRRQSLSVVVSNRVVWMPDVWAAAALVGSDPSSIERRRQSPSFLLPALSCRRSNFVICVGQSHELCREQTRCCVAESSQWLIFNGMSEQKRWRPTHP